MPRKPAQRPKTETWSVFLALITFSLIILVEICVILALTLPLI